MLRNFFNHLRPKRRWLQFSLGSLLLLITVLAVWLGWQVNRVRREREAIALVERLGGEVYFDYQVEENVPLGHFVTSPARKPPAPDWLRWLVGEDYFRRVASVELRDTKVTDEDLHVVAGLRRLWLLDLSNTSITNAGLAHLKGLRELRGLTLINTDVDSAGLAHLRNLDQLRALSLWKTKVDDAGLGHLRGLVRLRTLILDETRVTDAGLPQLKHLIGLDQWFGLSGTAVTDAGLNDLKGFIKLKQLNLRHTKVTLAAARELRKSLPNTDVSQGP